MANTLLASVELLLADLTVIRDQNLATLSGPKTALTPSLIPPLAAFTHWAIQIRNQCYEVTSKTYEAVAERDQYELRISTPAEWEARRQHYKLKFEKVKVGATKLSDEEILVQAHFIWLSRFKTEYQLTTKNCQNFAKCLYEAVKVPISAVSHAERKIQRLGHISER